MKVHYKTINRILSYARGSFYRLNAKTANYYHFSLLPKEKNRIEWQGGYSWGSNYGDDYLLDLTSGKLITPFEN